RVAGYVQRALTADEMAEAEQHLQLCDFCLSEVQEAFKLTAALTRTAKKPVPASVQTRVAELWGNPSVAAKALPWSRLVIRVAQTGLTLLERHLIQPVLDVQASLVPVPAYRRGEDMTALNIRLQTGEVEIQATAVQEGTGVTLSLTLGGAGQETLAGQRVFLRQHGRSIFSAKTDQDGVL